MATEGRPQARQVAGVFFPIWGMAVPGGQVPRTQAKLAALVHMIAQAQPVLPLPMGRTQHLLLSLLVVTHSNEGWP